MTSHTTQTNGCNVYSVKTKTGSSFKSSLSVSSCRRSACPVTHVLPGRQTDEYTILRQVYSRDVNKHSPVRRTASDQSSQNQVNTNVYVRTIFIQLSLFTLVYKQSWAELVKWKLGRLDWLDVDKQPQIEVRIRSWSSALIVGVRKVCFILSSLADTDYGAK